MGQEIVYCFKCQRRVLGDELDKGTAYQVGNQITCASCAVHVMETLPPREKEKLLAKMFRETKDRQATPAHSQGARKRSDSSPQVKLPPRPPARRRTGLFAGLAIGFVAAAVGLILTFGGSPTPVRETRPADDAEQRKRQAAVDALRKARDFAQSRPEEVDAQATRWQEAVFAAEGTPYLADAKREHEAARVRQRESLAKDLTDLDQRVAPLLEKSEYKAAFEAVDSIRPRRAVPEWTVALTAKTRALEAAVSKELAAVKEQAVAAKRKGDEAEAVALRTRVSTWGRAALVSELDLSIAAVPLPAPLQDAALVGYWPLDEGAGLAAADVSGKGHTAKLSGAAWVAGRFGSALRFDGVDSFLELSRSPELDRLQEGDYTLAGWVRPEGVPPAKADSYAILMKPGMHSGIGFNHLKRFFMGHWVQDPRPNYDQCDGGRGVEPGEFHHVAATVDRTAGRTKIYVDGVQEGSSGWTPKAPCVNLRNSPWRVGSAVPGAPQYRSAAKAVIDEVRLYARALGAAEVQILHRARPASK